MTKIAISTMSYFHTTREYKINWEELNTSFVNRDVSAVEICCAIYDGHPLCAWMDGRRAEENFILGQHIGIDMDTMDYRSSLDALVEHPLVKLYGAIIYRTPSSRSHKPRSRVIFLLDKPIETASGYRLAVEVISSMFEGVDPACAEPSRFFFGNGSMSKDQDPTGIYFSEKIKFPLSNLRLMAGEYLNNMKEEDNRQRKVKPIPKDTFEQQTMERVFERLDKVDAYSLDYREWQKVCSGLKTEFGDAAFDSTRMWSDKPGKDSLTRKYWDTLGKSGTPVTIATVMQMLREHGA
jgi:hypothetical protein